MWSSIRPVSSAIESLTQQLPTLRSNQQSYFDMISLHSNCSVCSAAGLSETADRQDQSTASKVSGGLMNHEKKITARETESSPTPSASRKARNQGGLLRRRAAGVAPGRDAGWRKHELEQPALDSTPNVAPFVQQTARPATKPAMQA